LAVIVNVGESPRWAFTFFNNVVGVLTAGVFQAVGDTRLSRAARVVIFVVTNFSHGFYPF
jgi:hypothetical protein